MAAQVAETDKKPAQATPIAFKKRQGKAVEEGINKVLAAPKQNKRSPEQVAEAEAITSAVCTRIKRRITRTFKIGAVSHRLYISPILMIWALEYTVLR